MKISVIVPAYNEERLIGQTLEKVHEAMTVFSDIGWASELIVCDNNSTDRTAELAGQAGATVVFETINKICRARNRGAAAASGQWLVFVDADSQPSPALFADMIEQIQANQCLAGGSTIQLEGNDSLGLRVAKSWNWFSRSFRLLAGSFIFCNAEAFREIGGFNNEFFASEELDLTKRLKKLARQTGKRIVILHRNPLLTSARKLQLYTPWEMLWFMARTMVTFGGTLKRRESCHVWYDGRR
jgi:cellulose synthase/poly-beta-1,6-N-acetylglucosamine synthase-like glycosyltransferase